MYRADRHSTKGHALVNTVYDSNRRRVGRREQNLIAHIGKSEAEVTNNKRRCSRYCIVEANYRQTKYRAACATAEYVLFVTIRTTEFVINRNAIKQCNFQ